MNDKLTLKEVFKKTREIALSKEFKATIILDIIVEKKRRNYLNLVFAYLRWVDDTVDNPKIPVEFKIEFINRQKEIIKELLDENEIEYKTNEEFYISYLIRYSKQYESPQLIEEINNMVEAISWDVERLKKDGIFCDTDLQKYINTMAKSLFNILNIFLLPARSNFNPLLYLGKFTANAQMLRDLLEDFDAGFINISREDIAKYKLNPKELKKDIHIKEWLKEKIPNLMQILNEETKTSWKVPFKNKVYVYWAHLYYLPEVFRPKIYNYNLEKMKYRKSLFREFIVYLFSSFMALKLFFKNFIISPQYHK
jgi:phytoene/squalene synthetase